METSVEYIPLQTKMQKTETPAKQEQCDHKHVYPMISENKKESTQDNVKTSRSNNEDDGLLHPENNANNGSRYTSTPEAQTTTLTKSSPTLCSKIVKTIAIDAAYFAAALSLGIIGPSLIDLEAITNTTGSEIATIFVLRGIFAIIGSLVLNPVLEIFNRYISVAISLLFTGVLTMLAPLSRSLAAILLTLGPPEFFGCALGMGTHLLCVEIWKAKAGPFLQLLNFVSIFGFAVAPLIVEPFLSHSDLNTTQVNSEKCQDTIEVIHIGPTNETITDVRYSNQALAETILSVNSTQTSGHINEKSLVYIAYEIVGVYCLFATVIFVFILYFDKSSRALIRRINPLEEDTQPHHSYPKKYLIFLYIQFYLLILFYGGIEVGYCGLVPTFAVRQLCWSKEKGALVVTVVQGCNATFTALGIFLSHIIRPQVIIIVDIIIVVISLVMLNLYVLQYPNVLWICSAFLGIGSASIMPSAYTWANDLFEITGVFNGFYWCGFFSGYMLMPAITGFLMDTFDKMWFCHIFMICAVVDLVIFCSLLLSVKFAKGSTNTKVVLDNSVETKVS